MDGLWVGRKVLGVNGSLHPTLPYLTCACIGSSTICFCCVVIVHETMYSVYITVQGRIVEASSANTYHIIRFKAQVLGTHSRTY